MAFGGRQVKGRAAIVVAGLHVLVGVVKPETEDIILSIIHVKSFNILMYFHF